MACCSRRRPILPILPILRGMIRLGWSRAAICILVTDFRYKEQADIEAGWLKAMIREGKMDVALAETILAAKVKRVGFEANRATFGQIHALDKAIKEKAGKEAVELVPVEDVLVNIRKVKDDHEIDLIRKSAAVAEEAFTAIRDEIKVGTDGKLSGGAAGV